MEKDIHHDPMGWIQRTTDILQSQTSTPLERALANELREVALANLNYRSEPYRKYYELKFLHERGAEDGVTTLEHEVTHLSTEFRLDTSRMQYELNGVRLCLGKYEHTATGSVHFVYLVDRAGTTYFVPGSSLPKFFREGRFSHNPDYTRMSKNGRLVSDMHWHLMEESANVYNGFTAVQAYNNFSRLFDDYRSIIRFFGEETWELLRDNAVADLACS